MDLNLFWHELKEMIESSGEWLRNSPFMDLQTTAICAAVFIVSAVMVYLISVFGIKGQTYEEAIEQQRQRNKEAMQMAKHDRSRNKKFRRWSRKSKDQEPEEEKGSPIEENGKGAKHCDNKHDVEAQNFAPEFGFKAAGSKKKKKKGKPISKSCQPHPSSSEDTDEQRSHSENEKKHDIIEERPIEEEANVVKQHSQEYHICIEQNEQEEENGSGAGACGVQGTTLDSSVVTVENSGKKLLLKSPNKKNKRSKSEQSLSGAGDAGMADTSKVLSLLREGTFCEEEINAFYEALSTKLSDSGCWTTKNDQISALKKQLQEKEDALEAERKLLQSANERLKNMRQLSQEKSRAVASERSLREKLNQLQQEVQNLHSRLKLTHDQHASEMQAKLQQMKAKLNEEHNIAIQRLKEENSQLQVLNRRESEKNQMSNIEISRLKHEIEQLVNQREQYESRQVAINQRKEDLHHQIQQLESHIEQLVTSHQEEEFTYKQQLNDLRNNLQQAEKTHSSMVKELQNAQSVCTTLEADNSAFRQRLEEAKHQITNLEQDRIQLQAQLEEMHKQHREMAVCLEQLQNEVNDLTKTKTENVKQIEELKGVNEALFIKLADSINHPDTTKDQSSFGDESPNDTLCANNEDMICMEEHKAIVNEKDGIIQRLHQKVIEQEQDVKATLSSVEVLHKQTKDLLQQLFPTVEINNLLDDESWLQEFEKEAPKALTKIKEECIHQAVSEEISKLNKKLGEFHKENNKLKEQVAQYQGVLTETEHLLFELQCRAEQREKVWNDEISEKEKLLAKTKLEINELQSKLHSQEKENLSLSQKNNKAAAKISDLQKELDKKQQCGTNEGKELGGSRNSKRRGSSRKKQTY